MTKRRVYDPTAVSPATGLDVPQNINIWSVRKRFLRVYAAALGWGGVVLDGQTLRAFVDSLHEELPRVDYRVLAASCAYIVGLPLTRGVLAPLCWRLAARSDELERGEPVYPWLGQTLDQFAAVQIIGVSANSLRLRVLTGKAAGSAITVDIALPRAARLFKVLGFSARKGLAFSLPRMDDLLYMLFICRFIPAAGPQNVAMWYRSYKTTPKMQRYNRALLRARRALPRTCSYRTSGTCATCDNRLCPAYGYLFVDCDLPERT